jgi:hypothetical protein
VDSELDNGNNSQKENMGRGKKVERGRREKDVEYASYVIHNIQKY